MSSYGYIYKAFYKEHYYIGQKTGKFNPNYFGSGAKWNEYLKDKDLSKIKLEILKECSSAEELNYWERHYIKQYNSPFNINRGGSGTNTIEHREKLSKLAKEHMTLDKRKQISKTLSKRIKKNGFSKLHREKLSRTNQNKKREPNISCARPLMIKIRGKELQFISRNSLAYYLHDIYGLYQPFNMNQYVKLIESIKQRYELHPKNKEVYQQILEEVEYIAYMFLDNPDLDFKFYHFTVESEIIFKRFLTKTALVTYLIKNKHSEFGRHLTEILVRDAIDKREEIFGFRIKEYSV